MARFKRTQVLVADFGLDPLTNNFKAQFAIGWKMAIGGWVAH